MKILTALFALLMASSSISAQDFPLRFVDSQGNEVANGTILELTEVEDLGYGDVQIPSGLFVENLSSDDVICGTAYTITNLPNGAFQTCFPGNCVMREDTGSWTSETGTIGAKEKKSIQTEWIPFDAGTAVVDYQLLQYTLNDETGKYTDATPGPKVTMKFIYNPTLVRTVGQDAHISSITYHTLDGLNVSSPTNGIYIVRVIYTNGEVKTSKQLF